MTDTCICVYHSDTAYYVDPATVREVEPGRYLCVAYKHGRDGELREVQHLGTLDRVARLAERESMNHD